MSFNQLFPKVLAAYVADKDCVLSNSQCNELSKYVERLERENSAARAEGYREGERDGAVKALDELKLHIHYQTAGYPFPSEIDKIINKLKSAYEKGSEGND